MGAFWDSATITLLVGMIFTKVGCVLNGCCSGRPSSGFFSVNLPNERGVKCPRVPSQLIECGLAAVLLLGALLWRTRPFDGALFLSAVAIYSAARIPLGMTRERVDRMGRVDIYNTISVGLALGSVVTIAIMAR
jgi:Prolipoprotein diacylglyceryltransferase